jgi:acetolactate synthase-1/2/3 large subunit
VQLSTVDRSLMNSHSSGSAPRVGGHLVAESLVALGASTAVGVPGQHALGIYDGFAQTDGIRFVGLRTEVGASFAAHGFAVAGGAPAPLMVSTGPGALMSLAGLQEAATTGAPVVCIASEIPTEGANRGRGFVHELDDQIAHFAPLVKRALHVRSPETIPDVLAEAWQLAASAPSGPAFVEIPVDVLAATTDLARPESLLRPPVPLPPRDDVVRDVAARLSAASRVAIFAGGGVLRAEAWRELAALAERLDAPVVVTYGGKGALPDDHPLYAGSACEDSDVMRCIGEADVALVVGSSLSEETTNHFTMRFDGDLVQIDADATKIGNTYRAVPVRSDAKLALSTITEALGEGRGRSDGRRRAAALRARIDERLGQQGRELERGILRTIRDALPPGAITAWDMTIMAYWSTMDFPVSRPRTYLYPQGSGTLGYGFPAAIGAKLAVPEATVLAIAGDGGIMYGLPEIAAANQAGLALKVLIVDDGGYAVLREYQRDAFGRTFATHLDRPNFVDVFAACGVPARRCEVDQLAEDLDWALAQDGSAAVVLDAEPVMFQPTHLDD